MGKLNEFPGISVFVKVSAENPCARCHKRLKSLLAIDTANFGAIKVCFRCLEALRSDEFITELEYQQIFVKKAI